MWISREKWEALVRRVDALESANKHSANFEVYQFYEQSGYGRYGFSQYGEPQRISVKDVVQRILRKLGMELKYVQGAPARVDVCDAASHAEEEKK